MDNLDDKIYALEVDYDNFKSFIPKSVDVSLRCKGQRLDWKDTLDIEIDAEDLGMPEADISLLNIGSFVMLRSLFNELFSDFKSDFELLPLSLDGREYYLCNVVNIVDCLDKGKSMFNEFGGVSKAVFDASKLPAGKFFKIPEDNCTSIFCTKIVKDVFEKNALSGVEFDEFDVTDLD